MDTYNYSSPPVGQAAAAGSTLLALGAGLVAAIVAGGLWAILVLLTSFEIGYAAWGIGVLVGLAMARMTEQRSAQLAYTAAALALVGLLAGKAFIFMGSTNRVAEEFLGDDDLMRGALAWQMYEERTLEAPTLEAIDATRAAGDTLSDALWANMLQQSGTQLASMTAEQREEFANVATVGAMASLGLAGGITAQLTVFDLLWAFLALGTAFRMMSPAKEQMAEPQPA